LKFQTTAEKTAKTAFLPHPVYGCMHALDPVNLNPHVCKKYDATCCASAYTHYTLSGATIIEQFLFIDICIFAMICFIPGYDGPIGLHV